MKLNKKTGGTLSTSLAAMSMSKIEDAMKELTQIVSEVGQVEVLRGALQYWPFPMKLREDHSGEPVYLNTDDYKFLNRHLMDIWNGVIPQFVERHFNEAEQEDYDALKEMFAKDDPNTVLSLELFVTLITNYFNAHYPIPEPEMFHSLRQPMNFTISDSNTFLDMMSAMPEQKDYFMPSLKVLNMADDGVLWSPVYNVPWTDNELTAEHVDHRYAIIRSSRSHGDQALAMQDCDCGIYASVNVGELWQYLNLPDQQAANMGMDARFDQSHRKLCIIEPASNATVFMARKGWKASRAFVSEIVGETISPASAAELISMVWRRPIDIRKVFDKGAYK